jgi:hypothetical protein
MGRNNRHGRGRHGGWNSQNGQSGQNQGSRRDSRSQQSGREVKTHEPVFQRTVHESAEDQQKKDEAIRELKAREVVCPICGKVIEDMSSAIADKATGKPAHFDCILEQLGKAETLGENDRIAYIGQGRFAVLHYDNPRDQKSFKIIKTIDWESREQKLDWRDEMSGLFSQVL